MRLKYEKIAQIACDQISNCYLCVAWNKRKKRDNQPAMQWWLGILVVNETKEKNHRFVKIKFVKNGPKKGNGATQQVTRARQKVWLRAKPTRLREAP